MAYEFSDSDANLIKRVGFRMTSEGVLLIAAGVAGIIYGLAHFSGGDHIALTVYMVQSIVEIVIGVSLIGVPSFFTRVAETSGKDIDELMGGMSKMSGAFRVVWVTLTLNLLLDLFLIIIGG